MYEIAAVWTWDDAAVLCSAAGSYPSKYGVKDRFEPDPARATMRSRSRTSSCSHLNNGMSQYRYSHAYNSGFQADRIDKPLNHRSPNLAISSDSAALSEVYDTVPNIPDVGLA